LDQCRACIELKKSGLTKHIGVANYNGMRIQEILDAGLEIPEANQIEFHPLCAQVELTGLMRNHSIAPIAYSPLAPLSTWRVEEGQGARYLLKLSRKVNPLSRQYPQNWGWQRQRYC
jgi:2,5-diketo-D-gluconate reductase A